MSCCHHCPRPQGTPVGFSMQLHGHTWTNTTHMGTMGIAEGSHGAPACLLHGVSVPAVHVAESCFRRGLQKGKGARLCSQNRSGLPHTPTVCPLALLAALGCWFC